MNARGSYGNHVPPPTFIVGTPVASSGSHWGGLAVLGLLGAGYLLLRPFVKKELREIEQAHREAREKAREVGLREGMTQAEQDRAWDTHYEKHGYPEDLPQRYRK